MNIKGILRSTAAKLIAFVCIVGCFAGALFLTEDTITDFAADNGSNMVYRFEGDFADSYYMCQQLSIMCAQMTNAFEDGMDAAEFSRQHTDFAGNYFGRMGDKTVGNDALTEAETKNSAFYMIGRPGGNVESNVGISYGYPLAVYDEETDSYGYYTEEDTAEEGWKFNKFNPYPSNTLLLVRFTDAQAAPIKAEWETQKTQITGVINQAVVLTAIALLLFVYLLFVTGRRPEDEEMHLVTLDRLPVEVNVVLFWSVLGTAAGLNIALMIELLSGSGDLSFLLLPSILFFVAAFAFALELTLSLVRLLKAGSLARRSWCIRAFRWCFNKIGVLCTGTWHGLGRLRLAFTKALLGNYKTRNVVLLFTAYSVVLAFLAAAFAGVGGSFFAFVLGVGWFLAAGYFLIRRIDGFDRIVAALQRMRGGDLSFRLTDMPEGVFAAMAEDLGSLGDGMQAALQNEVRAERMKSELITNVSHDLKTPLALIGGYAEAIAQDISPEENARYLAAIEQETDRMNGLVREMLDYTRLDRTDELKNRKTLNLTALVRDMLTEYAPLFEKRRLTADIADGVRIRGDETLLRRAVGCLLENAAKYSPENGRVSVRLTNSRNHLLTVENDCEPIPEDELPLVKKKFYKGSSSVRGTGIGLAVCDEIVEMHGGTLTLENAEGGGTLVTIRLPAEH